MILHGYIETGETPFDAIARIAVLAGQNGYDGYELRCRECNSAYGKNFDCKCSREYERQFIAAQQKVFAIPPDSVLKT